MASLITTDPHRQEATKRRVEGLAAELAGPGASPLVRLLSGIKATLKTEFDVASGRNFRIAGIPGGLETPTGLAADRWAKSAARATAQTGKALAVAQAVERRKAERAGARTKFKVAG